LEIVGKEIANGKRHKQQPQQTILQQAHNQKLQQPNGRKCTNGRRQLDGSKCNQMVESAQMEEDNWKCNKQPNVHKQQQKNIVVTNNQMCINNNKRIL